MDREMLLNILGHACAHAAETYPSDTSCRSSVCGNGRHGVGRLVARWFV